MSSEQAAQADSPESSVKTAQEIEDSLAAKFEQAEPEEKAAPEPESTDTAEEGDGLEEVEYEGASYRVPPPLKEAIIRQSDYTNKTREVAEAKRHIELQGEAFKLAQAESAFQQTISEPVSNLAILEARTKDLLQNWQSLSVDQKQELLFLDKQREAINREIEGKRREFDEKQRASMHELLTKTQEAVRKSIPGWNDELAKEITSHALKDGYTQQELSSISDARHIKTLWKAREYDRLQAKAKAPAVKTPPVVKPGPSNPMPQQTKDKLAFRKEMNKASSPTQKARLIEERFAKQFGG